MPQTDIAQAIASDLANAIDDTTIDTADTDGATGAHETTYQCTNWSQWYGYYTKIAPLKQAIDMTATWCLGGGWKADIRTTVILERMQGWGNDTFNSILKNMLITMRICGDAYCEIVRDDNGNLLNLKPLDPGSMRIIADKKGMLKRYEQTSKSPTGKHIKFTPHQIFHLQNKRCADSLAGSSEIPAVEDNILAYNELFFNVKKVFQRHVRPMMAFKLDTDDTTRIAAFKVKMDAALAEGENFYIPKDTVEFELVGTPSGATLNPMPWLSHLRDQFFQALNIPQILLGSSGDSNESTAKIAFTAFEQSVKSTQLEIEQQIWRQLFLKVKLVPAITLREDLMGDRAKDGANQQLGFQPNDVTAGVGE